MLSIQKCYDLARQFVQDASIKEAERDDVPVYVVKNIQDVIHVS